MGRSGVAEGWESGKKEQTGDEESQRGRQSELCWKLEQGQGVSALGWLKSRLMSSSQRA